MRFFKAISAAAGAGVAFAYLLNPGAGAAELVPDAIPVLGHADELGAVALLVVSVRALLGLVHTREDDDGPGGRLIPVPVRRR